MRQEGTLNRLEIQFPLSESHHFPWSISKESQTCQHVSCLLDHYIFFSIFEDTFNLKVINLSSIFELFRHMVCSLAPGLKYVQRQTFSLLFPRLFEIPKYRDYSYQFSDFELYLTTGFTHVRGFKLKKENIRIRSLKVREMRQIFPAVRLLINPPHFSDFPTTERNIQEPYSTLRTCSPDGQSHQDCTQYFTTLQHVFHILVGSLETSLSLWLESQGQSSWSSTWLFLPHKEMNRCFRTSNFIFLDTAYFKKNLLLLLLRF